MGAIGYIQVTRACNQHCLFCSNPPNESVYTAGQIKEMIDQFASEGYSGVILSGGEPTCFEQLPEVIAHAAAGNLVPRIITNGQRLADAAYLDTLLEAGLKIINFSIHSCRDAVHDRITSVPGSLRLAARALEHCRGRGIGVNINTVINAFNADHLDETVDWLIEKFPHIGHVVWNNLDPFMNRVEEHPEVRCRPWQFEVSLQRAARLLEAGGHTFRIERVPLCYMAEFAHCSTETRKIVKEEERTIYFLDNRGKRVQYDFYHEKGEVCGHCRLSPICAGVFGGERNFPFGDLFPVFLDPEPIRERILR